MSWKLFRLSFLFFFSLLLLQVPNSFAYTLDKTAHTLTVTPDSTPTANTSELRNAVNYLINRPDKTTLWTMALSSLIKPRTAIIVAYGISNIYRAVQ